MAQITCKNLLLGYEGKVISNRINFEINRGDMISIIGENGAGKSTLIETILDIFKPIEGEVIYGDGIKANEIGYLEQETSVQKDFPASVYEIVLSGFQSSCGFRPFYNKREKQNALLNIEKIGIGSLRKICFRELSGGQKQKVLLARALCASKKIIILDEPVSGLDKKSSIDFYRVIKDLNQNEKLTVIMVSHDVEDAIKNSSHILSFEDEKAVLYSREEYINNGRNN